MQPDSQTRLGPGPHRSNPSPQPCGRGSTGTPRSLPRREALHPRGRPGARASLRENEWPFGSTYSPPSGLGPEAPTWPDSQASHPSRPRPCPDLKFRESGTRPSGIPGVGCSGAPRTAISSVLQAGAVSGSLSPEVTRGGRDGEAGENDDPPRTRLVQSFIGGEPGGRATGDLVGA